MAAATRAQGAGFPSASRRYCRRALGFFVDTLRSYRRAFLVVAAVFLVSGGVSFWFGLEYRAFVIDEATRERKEREALFPRFDHSDLEKLCPELGWQKQRPPSVQEEARKALHEFCELTAYLALGVATLTLLAILTGCAFGIVPIVLAAVAGVWPGVALRVVLEDFGVQRTLYLATCFAPTLLVSLPALLLGVAIGLRLAGTIAQRYMGAWWQDQFRRGLKAWAYMVLPMLALATGLQIAVVALVMHVRAN